MSLAVVSLALILPFGGLLGLAMGGGPARRAALVAVATCALAVPFFLPEVWQRLVMAFGVAMTWLRVFDLALEKRPLPAGRRILHATMMMELRRTPRVPPSIHVPSLLRMSAFGGIAVAVVTVIVRTPASSDLGTRLLRWSCGVVASYTLFDSFAAFAVLLWRGLGFALEPVHDDPIKSRSVGEFWSQRWNRVVGAWLRDHCFRRLARRRRAALGVAAAFAVSTILHVYLAWAVLDASAALMWAVFFSLQVPVVLLERTLRVASWRPALGRTWTIGVLLALSPLFVDPMLRCFDALR